MNDDEAFVIDHAERDETDLAVVATFPLRLVPFEFHEPPPISLH